ncbi:MAG: hypothetical protein ACK4SF_05535 [Algoriphagus aquaeductus]|uniref:Uncharacterized protein n=1 Tax=Algoriphagus aquaeductus TaxID=475299 RepID=A0A326RS45_9BACT|nr:MULTISPECIES: hypothetical protein [Algoriphagus]PZV84512.1 hypothetical protein CLV31_104163 [Algoriphagus aquaeductus]
MKTITLIEKEQISQLNFGKKEVLNNPEDRKKRLADLYRSQTLGNLLQTKVKIIFETADEQVYQVNTTVWAVGSDFISLKGGVYIPINAILEVN